ncbi:Pyroglutamyl-peptidase I [Fimbriimonas ginsengisoli Gsoil 348]|uniref:Pyroglutamyl-peptidase I n=1 Tax=Fimbriimonas ginsengisoli Gsoil 348 TaxID=661478 RepID=A0A068NKJ7_FIMGI|nr:Pyroglutamyl-peptidase I [Fimbriimonas ginsengisoli Gsoil 348]
MKENPSAILAEGTGRPFRILEVAFEAVDEFLASLDPASFDRLVLMGVATGRTQITPELFARNQIGHTRDVRGNDRFGPIDPAAPLLLEGTLWIESSMVELFPNPDLKISLDAGSYLCNYSYFRALQRFPQKQIGFLHVPQPAKIPLERQQKLVSSLIEHVESR